MVTIGKFRRYKCLHHAILVLSRIHELGIRDAQLVIAGRREDENYERYMLDLVEELGMSSSVQIETDITEDRKADLLLHAKLLLVPSPTEGFGRTAIEANLFGVPVIGTTGVPSDVVQDGHTGYRVPFGDVDAFARIAIRLLRDDTEWASLSQEAIRHGKLFTWDATMNMVRSAMGELGL